MVMNQDSLHSIVTNSEHWDQVKERTRRKSKGQQRGEPPARYLEQISFKKRIRHEQKFTKAKRCEEQISCCGRCEGGKNSAEKEQK
jgi:ribosomal protein L19E